MEHCGGCKVIRLPQPKLGLCCWPLQTPHRLSRFATRRAIEGTFTGRHTSRRHGGAGEFADFREYTEGEDLRRLDWKVLARTGRAYTRLHQDETNFVCTLVLDASESMRFASGGRTGNSCGNQTSHELLLIAGVRSFAHMAHRNDRGRCRAP